MTTSRLRLLHLEYPTLSTVARAKRKSRISLRGWWQRSRVRMSNPDNKCGTCTMCCKLLFVNELKKPKNTWCEHCAIGTGCKVYQDRPASCAGFKCLWLQSQEGFQ